MRTKIPSWCADEKHPLSSRERKRDVEDIDDGESRPVQHTRTKGEGASPAWHWHSGCGAHLPHGGNLLIGSSCAGKCSPALDVVKPTSDVAWHTAKGPASISSVPLRRTGNQYLGRPGRADDDEEGQPPPSHAIKYCVPLCSALNERDNYQGVLDPPTHERTASTADSVPVRGG